MIRETRSALQFAPQLNLTLTQEIGNATVPVQEENSKMTGTWSA